MLCFFVEKTEGNSSLYRLAMLFDIAILNAGTFITGAFVRNFVFIDLCAFEVFNENTVYSFNKKGISHSNRRLARTFRFVEEYFFQLKIMILYSFLTLTNY